MLVISTLGSLVISWWPRSLVRAWMSDKPPVTTLVSISWLVAVPGLTWLHYRPSITSLTPPTHPSCCSATAAAASQLPSWSCEPRCCLATKKPLAGPEWWRVQAESWSHHTGLAVVTVVTIGALCSVLAMLGGPQPSPSVLNAMSRDSMTDTIGSTLLGETAGSLDPRPRDGAWLFNPKNI